MNWRGVRSRPVMVASATPGEMERMAEILSEYEVPYRFGMPAAAGGQRPGLVEEKGALGDGQAVELAQKLGDQLDIGHHGDIDAGQVQLDAVAGADDRRLDAIAGAELVEGARQVGAVERQLLAHADRGGAEAAADGQ